MNYLLSRFLRVFGVLTLLVACAIATGLYIVVRGRGGDAVFPADCGVVFGAAVHPVFDTNGKFISIDPGPGILRRVETAVAFYRAHQLQKLFMTGGRGEGMSVSEAEVMRDEAVREGVLAADITLEEQSHSTEENIRFTRSLTGSCSSVVAISDDYHLARIGWIARMQGWELSTAPAQGKPDALFEAQSVIREVGALFMFTLKSLLT